MIALMRHCGRFGAALLLGILLAGCGTVRFVSAYDEPTDQALSELQRSSDDFIVDLIAHASTDDDAYARHLDFYRNADQQLRRLEFRVSSIPANERTVALVDRIRAVILGSGICDPDGASLRDLHCNAGRTGPSPAALELSRRNINQTISAALALELAKKTGD